MDSLRHDGDDDDDGDFGDDFGDDNDCYDDPMESNDGETELTYHDPEIISPVTWSSPASPDPQPPSPKKIKVKGGNLLEDNFDVCEDVFDDYAVCPSNTDKEQTKIVLKKVRYKRCAVMMTRCDHDPEP